MKKFIHTLFITLCSWILCTTAAIAQNKQTGALPFRFATRAEAQMLITNIDPFTTNWNQFDVDIRLQKAEGKKSQLLTVAMNATRNWSEEEKKRITQAMKALEDNLKKLKSPLQASKEIVFVKTSMVEEVEASAYTRENWIAIGEEALTQMDSPTLQYLLAHEVFHVLTRHNLNFKKAIYATIGFTVNDQEIRFPADLVQKRISNPDISRYDSYTTFQIDGKDENCMMVLYTDKEYVGGNLSDYLKIGIVPLNEELIPVQMNGETVIYPVSKVMDELYLKVGRNTDYLINPEEIAADNFAFAITNKKDLSTPEVVQKTKEVLKSKF